MQLDTPSSSATGRLGSFMKKGVDYDIWHLGDDAHEVIGGEELKNLTCLIPRKKKGGKLYAGMFNPLRLFLALLTARRSTTHSSFFDTNASHCNFGSSISSYTPTILRRCGGLSFGIWRCDLHQSTKTFICTRSPQAPIYANRISRTHIGFRL